MDRPRHSASAPRRRPAMAVPVLLLAVSLAAATALAGCWNRAADQGPVPVRWDRDIGAHCGMVISDRRFAAQAVDPDGTVHKFDDIGCLIAWLQDRDVQRNVRVWVRDADGSAWLDARQAHYRPGALSPMGYGFLAGREPAFGPLRFTDVTARALEMERTRKAAPGRIPAPMRGGAGMPGGARMQDRSDTTAPRRPQP